MFVDMVIDLEHLPVYKAISNFGIEFLSLLEYGCVVNYRSISDLKKGASKEPSDVTTLNDEIFF